MVRKCPVCGVNLVTLQITRRAGCSDCYTHFSNEIITWLSDGQLHEDELLPRSIKEEIDYISCQKELETRLKSAIEEEDYESAAQIRDELNALKGAHNSANGSI